MQIILNKMTALEFQEYKKAANISFKYYKTPCGILQLSYVDLGMYEAKFITEDIMIDISNFLDINHEFDNKFLLIGTDFQIKVWQAITNIKEGQTESYKEIAKIIGSDKSYRAVARALAQNKIAYFIPCHRIIAKSGAISGYKWGVDKKLALLQYEKNKSYSNRVL